MKLSVNATFKRIALVLLVLAAAPAYAEVITIDGQFDPAEWANARQYLFTVYTPDGGRTHGELYVTNDATNM